jgi:hypothetical protein
MVAGGRSAAETSGKRAKTFRIPKGCHKISSCVPRNTPIVTRNTITFRKFRERFASELYRIENDFTLKREIDSEYLARLAPLRGAVRLRLVTGGLRCTATSGYCLPPRWGESFPTLFPNFVS